MDLKIEFLAIIVLDASIMWSVQPKIDENMFVPAAETGQDTFGLGPDTCVLAQDTCVLAQDSCTKSENFMVLKFER